MIRKTMMNNINMNSYNNIAPKYSIITPIYNSFELMEHYFRSLENQTYKDFEVILVDDCSNDDSYERAYNYTKKTSLSICVYKTDKNEGPGNARNLGMDKANGDWITFIDNDDWVDCDLLEKIDNVINKNLINCVIYDYYITNGEKHKPCKSISVEDYGILDLRRCVATVRNHTVGKFYKIECLRKRNIRFPNLRRCEDIAFVCRAIDACGSVYYLNKPMYYYYQRSSSLSNNKNLDESDLVKAFGILETSLSQQYKKEIKEKSVTDLFYGVLLLMCKAGKSTGQIKNYIHEYEQKYPDWYKCKSLKSMSKAKYLFMMAARFELIPILRQYTRLHNKLIG